jgi:hypothetical protein
MISVSGCTSFSFRTKTAESVQLPFIKNTSNECYYLDEFMPTPDSMVSGKYGRLSLRYYTYAAANYKDWTDQQIILSFYSQDDRCWSLFEEYYLKN